MPSCFAGKHHLYFLLVFIQFFLSIAKLNAGETGLFFIENTSFAHLGAGGNNYAIAQSSSGTLFVANRRGLLSFDGTRWQLLENTHNLLPVSIAIDSRDKIYLGNNGDFGYLNRDPQGQYKFHSLTSQLDEGHQVGIIRETIIRPDGVYFRSSRYIYYLTPENKLKLITPSSSSFHRMFVVNDKLLIQERKKALATVYKGQLTPVSSDKFLADKILFGVLPFAGDMLMLTNQNGLYLYNGASFQPFAHQAQELLENNRVYYARLLSNNLIALAIEGKDSGLLVLNPLGGIVKHITAEHGLMDDLINYIYEDHQKGLWLSLSNGLARINLTSPLTYFDQQHQLSGKIYDVTRVQQSLFVSTAKGVYRLTDTDKQNARFTQTLPDNEACYVLLPSSKGVLAACNESIYSIENQKVHKIAAPKFNFLAIHRLSDSSGENTEQYLIGHNRGLGLLQNQANTWHYRAVAEQALTLPIQAISQDKGLQFWLTTRGQGITKVRFENGFHSPPNVSHYDHTHGLPAGYISPSNIDQQLIFSTDEGFYQVNPDAGPTEPLFTPATSLIDPLIGENVYIHQQDNGLIWLKQEAQRGQSNGSQATKIALVSPGRITNDVLLYQWNFEEFTGIVSDIGVSLYVEADGVIWIVNNEQLLRYDSKLKPAARQPKAPVISQITDLSMPDNALFKLPLDRLAPLPYQNNSLRFHFAFASFDRAAFNRFQYRLEGYDEQWSHWSHESFKDYTQITEGEYSFEVRAKDAYGNISDTASLAFEILPPWYRTYWAYGLYLLVLSTFVYAFILYRTRSLKARAKSLEAQVLQRTEEIHSRNVLITQQKQNIEQLLSQKEHFFAHISHEFKTPLTLLLAPTKALLKNNHDPFVRKQLGIIYQNGQRLLSLVNQLLTLTKLSHTDKTGKLSNSRVKLPVNASLTHVINSFASLAEQKGITIRHSFSHEIVVSMQADALERIVFNLLSNALKYSPLNSCIQVSSQINNNELLLKVSDNGCGIAQSEQEKILQPFQRAESQENQKIPGTGLGLAIVCELVNLHQGKLAIDSELGQGASFTVTLPVVCNSQAVNTGPAPENPMPSPAKLKEDLALELNLLVPEEPQPETPVPVVMEPNLTGADSDQKTLLIIEDTPDMRSYIKSLFAQDYYCICAENGEQGIKLALEHLPDVIISDVMMPVKDGYQVCHTLKNHQETSHIPIILLTAKDDIESRKQGWREQADEYLAKPFDQDELKIRVANILHIRELMKRRFGYQLHLQPTPLPANISELSQREQAFLTKFKQVIQDNYMDSLFNLPSAASAMAVSERCLQKKLKTLLDHNFTEYLRTFRLKQACRLLEENQKAMDVADATGFSSQAYFSRCFKAEFGKTASQYQQEHKEKQTSALPA
ncbi:response regulator [Thalassomonas viridans]|uniref:histidine kinase n=1 Tax=Thalassomonas viridans TaxID=137584 RepID=A0AAF0C7B1_9GAMM|nr:ATP-binding protein [Thalassomonas viridans]WDE03508.1 response regulator [Thalassomonas viridans]